VCATHVTGPVMTSQTTERRISLKKSDHQIRSNDFNTSKPAHAAQHLRTENPWCRV
jgi:hypothetical protein